MKKVEGKLGENSEESDKKKKTQNNQEHRKQGLCEKTEGVELSPWKMSLRRENAVKASITQEVTTLLSDTTTTTTKA